MQDVKVIAKAHFDCKVNGTLQDIAKTLVFTVDEIVQDAFDLIE